MSDVFVGEVRTMPFGFVPRGWAPCQGQLMAIGANPALFSLLGNIYGGDGKTTFALPTLPPLAAKMGALQYCIAVQGMFPPR
jgi:microcystin-dependent protein